MTEETKGYCRLCAEYRSIFDMISPAKDIIANSKLITKLSWIHIDITSGNGFPSTICYACLDLLESAWIFLNKVRSAQEKLATLLITKHKQKVREIETENMINAQKLPEKSIKRKSENFSELKHEIKIENLNDKSSNLLFNDKFVKLNDNQLEIKNELNIIDDGNDFLESNDDLNDLSSDSDVPLKLSVFKKRGRPSNKEYIERTSILQNMSWHNQACLCAKCNLKCCNMQELQQHSIDIHNSCCIFKCAKCSKTSPGWRTFIRHSRTHNKTLKHCCEFCNKSFVRLKEINIHRIESHKYVYRTRCIYCGINFNTSEKLQEHKNLFSKNFKNRTLNGEEELKCDKCSKICKSRVTLQQHKKIHMDRSKDYACHICGQTFYKKGTLTTHLLVHQESTEQRFKCTQCPSAFRTKGNLMSHLSLHTGLKPFICEQCGKSFRIKRHLISHSIVHTDLRPFHCEYCKRSFRFEISLKQHLRQQICLHPKKSKSKNKILLNGVM